MGLGQRLTQSIASCSDLHFQSQNPAISSLVSANGPSITVRLSPENLTRAPFELGCSPLASSITPAFTISSLNFAMAKSSSSDGILPASESLVTFTITMKRIAVSPLGSSVREPDTSPSSIVTSNQRPRNRHAREVFGKCHLSLCIAENSFRL